MGVETEYAVSGELDRDQLLGELMLTARRQLAHLPGRRPTATS